ncbi:hypothetical protein [Streptomyces nogalater]|uniref:Uncharacterized protein n=1 Tax=Streptomyces nogalater TaxID=38314 RepID=A0ABW0W8R1_STRNO
MTTTLEQPTGNVDTPEVETPAEPPRYMRRGKCDTGRPLCGKPARWYPAGWRCDEHRPSSR